MTRIKAGDLARHNNAPYESRNFRVPYTPVEGFSTGDYVQVVVYNAFVGSKGKGRRSEAQRTHARISQDHALLDEFDPLMDLSLTPDGHPMFELVGYIVGENEAEHLLFTLKIQKNEAPTQNKQKSFPSKEFPVGSHPIVRIYRDRTPQSPGKLFKEFEATVTPEGLTLPEMQLKPDLNPATGNPISIKNLTYWLVRLDGTEHYLYSADLLVNEPPPISSLLTPPPDSVN